MKIALDLTYTISQNLKYYKDKTIKFLYIEKIQDNKINRETIIDFNSHMGTHIDYPSHCVKNGKNGNEYPLNYLFSESVVLVDVDLTKNKLPKLTKELLLNYEISSNTEILIIKTHFSSLRNDVRYIWESPIIDSDIPLFLKKKLPCIKAVCLDVISVTSQLDRDEGKKCHINFLSSNLGKEILIIEDINLQYLRKDDIIDKIYILPLKFENMDGSPCSIVVEIEREG
ncbi:cyclase family protein [Campylobacter jejuni]|nr:cyclase [Campylobacter jejuni]EED1947233.1 cyclase [Campylobacter jejuni]EEO6978006.1 cyclase [Campylobacter jejuni]MCW1365560.1 cyclase family protein [Campylobacter jejuni]